MAGGDEFLVTLVKLNVQAVGPVTWRITKPLGLLTLKVIGQFITCRFPNYTGLFNKMVCIKITHALCNATGEVAVGTKEGKYKQPRIHR